MADTPNYANSPLANPDFLNRVTSAPKTDPGFSPMAPGILDRAIAQEPVVQAKTLEERKRELEIEQAKLQDRSATEIIKDSLLTGSNAVAHGVESVAGLALKGTGVAVEALAPEGSIAQDIGGLISDRAMVQTSNMIKNTREFLDPFKTDTAIRNAELDGQISQINDEINLNQYKEDIAAGDSEFIASLSLYGRQALDFGERMTNPVAALDLGSNALGSVVSGSILSGIGSKIATGVAERFGIEGVKKLGLVYGGSALGMGVTEASSTYVGVVEDVMGRTPEEMVSSEMYRELIAQGMAHEVAQTKVADSAGLDAFVNQLPAAMTAGLLSAKFNANPLSVMRGENPLGVFITAGKEALEETAQGATGQYNQNKAIRDFVDPNQALDEGVVDSAIGGLLGGFAASGVIGAPSGVRNGFQEQAERIKEEVAYERFVKGMGEQIAAQNRINALAKMTPDERDADLRASMTQTSPAEDLFNSVVGKARDVATGVRDATESVLSAENVSGAVETLKGAVGAAKEAVTPVVNQVIKTAQDYVEKSNPVIQNEIVAAADSVSIVAKDPTVETGNIGLSDPSVKADTTPEVFKASVPEGASLADTLTGIVKTLSEKKIPISDMKDDAILFVAQKYNEMQNAASSLPGDVRENIKKVLSSPDLERIRKRAGRIDLNTAISPTIQKVSSTVKNMTVAMSKLNPTNVNPDVVDRILKQEDSNLTPEELRSMEVAASVSRPLNTYKENIVKIADDKYNALVATGQKVQKPESNVDQVSRNLIVGNLSGENKVPSINELANRVIIGMQSPDQAVEIDSVRVPVKEVVLNMRNLTQHMANKVNALNESFDKNDTNGVGPSIMHDTLVRGKDFIKAGMAGSKAVTYNRRSPNSVAFARTVGADAQVLAEVHNALAQAFPEQFPDGPFVMPQIKTDQVVESSVSETTEVNNQNTAAVEEVFAPAETDENAENKAVSEKTEPVEKTPEIQEVEEISSARETKPKESDERDATPQERAVIIAAIEKAFPGFKIPNLVLKVKTFEEDANGFRKGGEMYNGIMTLSPAVMERIMGRQTERTLHILRHEFGHWVDFSGEYAYSARRDWDAAVAEFDHFVKTKATEEQKQFLNYILSYRNSKAHKYPAEMFAELMGIMGVRPKFVEENMPTAFRIMNEALSEQLDSLSNVTDPEDTSSEIPEGVYIYDGNGKPLVFYHGTKSQFTNFAGNEIFLTTQRGLAKTHALRAGSKGTPRLVAAHVAVENPLMVELEGNVELDIYWLNNALTLKSDMAAGDHDSILLINEEGDAMVIATDDNQITQIEDPIKDRVFGSKSDNTTSERFRKVFQTKNSPPKVESAEAALDAISEKPGTRIYGEFARNLLPRISNAMNQRVASLKRLEGNTKTLADGLKEDQAAVLEIRDFKPLMIVDPETGTYNQRLLDLASLAVIDWMTTARPYGADRLDDLLEELELDPNNLSDQQIFDLQNTIPPRSTTEGLARKIMKMWNVRANSESEMVDIRGMTEGLVKEVFTVLSQMENPLIKIIEVEVGKGRAASFDISALAPEQEVIGLSGAGSLDRMFFPEDQIQASFGEKLTHVPTSQNNKPDVNLSPMERAAVKNMQDTAHLPAEPVISFFQALGLDAWSHMAGRRDSSKLSARHPLRFSIEGKNTSIERDFTSAFQMVDAAAGRPVFYPVGVTNVGRHQMKGINPQNNKVLRALITPTHSKLDMANNQAHKNGFWLTVAQSSGLAKVERKDHKKILATIQEDFNVKFGEATAIALVYLETGTLDSEAFANAMLKATKGEDVSVAQTNAVLAVARLQQAHRKNDPSHLENFETTLSFELDGKTDGPANMMVAFGQGLMTRAEFMNFKRVGLFLGSKYETLNTFLSENQDLYEVNSLFSTKRMVKMINEAKGRDRERLIALQRFAAHFGDFQISEDGSIIMSRATSKNPMTKKVYGSAEKGIAEGISQDMLIGFYTQLTQMPEGASIESHMGYLEIRKDLELLFGVVLPKTINPTQYILPPKSMAPFAELVKQTIGVVLSSSIEEVMDLKTIGVNNLLVYTTNVQGKFMELFFDQRLAEAMEELKEEFGEGDNQKKGKPTLRKMSQAAYDAIVKETMAFAPVFSDANQTLRIGDFTGQVSNTEMSSNLSGNIRPKSTMARPDNIGVKGIPYVIQGRGDAMMMNRIFGAENAPKKAIPIFDGIDMAITDFMDLSNQVNEAVLDNWDNDVIGPIVTNFEAFMERVNSSGLEDILSMAFDQVKKQSKEKTTVVAVTPSDLVQSLREAHRLSMARKTVFKEIPLSVDHMGGSGQAYVRNADGKELTYEEVNSKIQDHLDGKTSSNEPEIQPEVESTLVVTDVQTVMQALVRETEKSHLKDVIKAIRGMLPNDAQIIMGTKEEIQKWRSENLNQNPVKKLDQSTNGFYDVNNNIIFITSDNAETIVHEMIHMATFQAVLDHYRGVRETAAVKNLEVLMDEFLFMDTSGMSTEALSAYTSAKAAILKGKSEATPMGDAVALNEFMAWTLANDHLMKELKQTPTFLVQRMTKVAKAWIQRILGVVPLDMYSNILFNTEMIRNDEFAGFDLEPVNGGIGGNGNNSNNTGGVTPPASNFTNFWIDLLRQRLADAQNTTGLGQEDLIKKRATRQKLGKYYSNVKDALVKLDFGGFGLSEYQKQTFIAIHMVIAAELRLDTNALVALGKMYEHITNNLTPAMFGSGQNAQDRYSTVMELFGDTTNDEGISDAITVLLALSQTSSGFRSALEQIPSPEAQPGVQFTSLNDVLTSTTGLLMQKMVAATDTEGKGVKEILDALSDQIIRQDDQNEFNALRGLMNSFTKADVFVNGALSTLAQRTNEINRDIQNSTANGLMKTVAGAVTLATNFLDADLSRQQAKGAKMATHMDGMLDGAVFIRELVTEIVGADEINSDVIQMLDKVNYVVQSTRQAYREELPVILQNEFTNHPDAKGWKAFHTILGKLDFAALFDLKNPDESFDLLNDQNLLNARIARTEKKILKEFPGQTGKNILIKSQQLADFMNGKGAGFQLWKNAYAIHKLAGGRKPNQVATINRLISLYALNGSDVTQREYVARMQVSDPKGVHNLIVYMQALNKEEDQKTISEAARMNGYKGYIPNHAKGEISLIIAKDTDREDLERKGYTRVADDTTDTGSMVSRGYYVSTVKRGGNYSQGVLQQVQDTYRGVNSVTGLSVNGTVSGVISGVAVISITNALNNALRVNDPKNALIPVMDENGEVLYYERALNPDLMEKYLEPPANMALMLGAWAGRQVEEKFSHEYNTALIARLKEIWDTRESGTDGLFVRMDQAKDKIYAESWDVIPPQLKEHIMSVFGEETGFMVPKDMINLALGYRDPSIVDVWTGNNRLPESVELAVKAVGKMFMGDKAYVWMANTETAVMNTVSTAKDVIVVRSLVIPMMNIQSNVFQLVNLGIGTKKIMKGYREKFIEIDKLNENLKKIMSLKAQERLAATNKNRVAILRQQIQVLKDENKRFSVAPLVEAGAYKTISEGLTELDVSITDGKFGDWVESKVNKLPAGVQTVVKYGLLSKDTALYKGANKATQYGDFVAKSIYYDTLIEQGVSSEKALSMVNEEFVNFSVLPGRMRTGLEAIGATWFMAYKIRSMKTALKMMRDNPVRSLTAVGVLGLSDGPVTDNFATKTIEGTLPYALGWDMLWDTPAINPWVALTNG